MEWSNARHSIPAKPIVLPKWCKRLEDLPASERLPPPVTAASLRDKYPPEGSHVIAIAGVIERLPEIPGWSAEILRFHGFAVGMLRLDSADVEVRMLTVSKRRHLTVTHTRFSERWEFGGRGTWGDPGWTKDSPVGWKPLDKWELGEETTTQAVELVKVLMGV